MKNIIKYFFSGLIIVLPITITIYIIYALITWVDSIFPVVIFPGFGIIVVIVFITIIGVLGNIFISKPIFEWIDRILLGLPIISLMYKAFKDILVSLVGTESRLKTPVAVRLSSNGNIKLGFITQDQLDLIYTDQEESYLAVYFPHSYNFSGNLLLVPAANVTVLDRHPSSVMKFIVSGGIIDEDELHEQLVDANEDQRFPE